MPLPTCQQKQSFGEPLVTWKHVRVEGATFIKHTGMNALVSVQILSVCLGGIIAVTYLTHEQTYNPTLGMLSLGDVNCEPRTTPEVCVHKVGLLLSLPTLGNLF